MDNTLTMTAPLAFGVTFQSANKVVLKINADGTISAGDGFTPTEAGKLAIEAMRNSLADIIKRAVAAETDRCCSLIFGHCSSDVAAQRTVDAIRGNKKTPESIDV